MQPSTDSMSQNGSINLNGSDSMSQEQSLMINFLDSVASSKKISKDSKAYKCLSMIMQAVDNTIRTERELSYIQTSHILDSLSIDNRQSYPVNVILQNSQNSFNQLNKSQETKLMQEHCQQVVVMFGKQHEEQMRLERENNFMNLLIKFKKNPSADRFSEKQLIILYAYFKHKHKEYEQKCKKLLNQSKKVNTNYLNENGLSP